MDTLDSLAVLVQAWDGEYVVDNTIRLFIIFTGFTLGMLVGKIALRRFCERDYVEGYRTLAVALFVVCPSVSSIVRFGLPVQWEVVGIYLAALLLFLIAVIHDATWRPPWRRGNKG